MIGKILLPKLPEISEKGLFYELAALGPNCIVPLLFYWKQYKLDMKYRFLSDLMK